MSDEEPTPEETPKPGLGERIREHIRAAEVAAEEASGYGWVTETVEAVEAAVNPAHELGDSKHAGTSEQAQPSGVDTPETQPPS